MKPQKALQRGVFASLCFSAALFSDVTFSASVIVDFETIPKIDTGPSTFASAGPAQTIDIDGNTTFSGGVILGLPTFLPTTPLLTAQNLYATAYHPSGRVVGDPTLSPTLSIDIIPSYGATAVEGLLLNGLNRFGSYTIEAFSNETLVDSVFIDNLAPNLSDGFAAFSLYSTDLPITAVLFSPDTLDGEWDYFIDTITISQPFEDVVPLPASLWLFGSAVVSFLGFRKP